MYIWSYDDAVATRDAFSLKATCYCTVVYSPAAPVVDFGLPTCPPTMFKNDLSPRMLLVSTWTDGRWGFVGGRAKKGESPLQAVNREFVEETGTALEFIASDFCFATRDEKAVVFVFCRVTSDLPFFNSMLAAFYVTDRRAYPDEVLAITGYPIWLEGPPSVSEACWEKQIHGLPRHLVSNGGLMTPTFGEYFPSASFPCYSNNNAIIIQQTLTFLDYV